MRKSTLTKATMLSLAVAMGMSATALAEGFSIAVQNGTEPASIDPNEVNANDTMDLVLHMYEGIMRYSPEGGVECGQAESYEMSEDGLTYTFHLRDGIQWSDGQPVVAGDFIYSWQRLISGGYDNSRFLDMIVNAPEIALGEKDPSELGVVAEDDKTLVVSLSYPCAYFPQLLAAAVTSPLRQDCVESGDLWYADPETNIGNGAFVLTEWVNQDHMTMTASETFWEKDAIGPDSIDWMFMDDDNTILASFESGDIMFASQYPSDEYERLAAEDLAHIEPLFGTYYMMINYNEEKQENEALYDARVRRALALAIDRNYLCSVVTGQGEQPANSFVGEGFLEEDGTDFHANAEPWYDLDAYEANCEEAKALLADAGYPNGEGFPLLKYTINNGAGHQAVAEYLQSCWSEVLGINADIDSQEWAVFLDLRNQNDYQSARGGWTVDFIDPIDLFELWVTDGGNNDTAYSNPEYDELVEAAKVEADPATRFDLLHQAEKILGDDMVTIPIYHYTMKYLGNKAEYDGYFVYLAMPIFKYTYQVQ